MAFVGRAFQGRPPATLQWSLLRVSRRSLLLAAVGAGCRRPRGTGFPGYALVASPEARAVACVDLETFALAGHIRLAAPPHAVVAGSSLARAWALSCEPGALWELDPAGRRWLRWFSVGRSAAAVRLAAAGGAAWVLCRDPAQLVRIDLSRWERNLRLPLPGEPRDFDVAPDESLAAATLTDGAVALADLKDGRMIRRVECGRRAGLVRFRSDGKLLLVANADQAALSLLELPGGELVVHLPLAMVPERLCFKSDGGQLFVTGRGADAVAIVYPYRTEVAETVLVGRMPGAMAVCNQPEYLLVASPVTGDVSILEIETRRVIAVAAVGEGAGAIVITPDNQYALVLNERAGTLAVIRLTAVVARRARTAALFTVVPVGPRPLAAAVCRV